MANLIAVEDWLAIPGNEAVDPDIASALLDQVEAMLVAACNRTERPWRAGEEGIEESFDGTGRNTLFVGYPVADLTSVILGYDVDVPDETLDPDDKTELIWKVGSDRLTRVDGGHFGCRGWPTYVHVTYDSQDDLPDLARKAVADGASAVYHRGAVAVTSERLGAWSADYSAASTDAGALAGLDAWRAAISAYRVPPV